MREERGYTGERRRFEEEKRRKGEGEKERRREGEKERRIGRVRDVKVRVILWCSRRSG